MGRRSLLQSAPIIHLDFKCYLFQKFAIHLQLPSAWPVLKGSPGSRDTPSLHADFGGALQAPGSTQGWAAGRWEAAETRLHPPLCSRTALCDTGRTEAVPPSTPLPGDRKEHKAHAGKEQQGVQGVQTQMACRGCLTTEPTFLPRLTFLLIADLAFCSLGVTSGSQHHLSICGQADHDIWMHNVSDYARGSPWP